MGNRIPLRAGRRNGRRKTIAIVCGRVKNSDSPRKARGDRFGSEGQRGLRLFGIHTNPPGKSTIVEPVPRSDFVVLREMDRGKARGRCDGENVPFSRVEAFFFAAPRKHRDRFVSVREYVCAKARVSRQGKCGRRVEVVLESTKIAVINKPGGLECTYLLLLLLLI